MGQKTANTLYPWRAMAATVIVNPLAGAGRARRVLAELDRRQGEIAAALGESVRFLMTTGSGHGELLARQAVEAGDRTLIAVGGDGLIHEVVNGLWGSQATFGIVPAGSGNDIARALQIPRSPAGAIEILCNGCIRSIDLGRIGERCFVGFAGMGLDALSVALSRQSRLPLRGMRRYAWGVLRALCRYRVRQMSLVADGRRISGLGWILVVANTQTFGGGMVIAPDARLDDGLLDVCFLVDASRSELLSLFLRVLLQRPISSPHLVRIQARSLEIAGHPDLLIQADGEILGHPPAHIRVMPRVLSVLSPSIRSYDDVFPPGVLSLDGRGQG